MFVVEMDSSGNFLELFSMKTMRSLLNTASNLFGQYFD